MNGKETNIIYTAQDIEQYLSGKLTPLQMHAMEKAALDDLFLAEAIEGYEGMNAGEWKKELAALKTQFENNGTTAKVIALPKRNNNWWKAAAAVLLIGGITTIAYLMVNKKENQQIAQTVQKQTSLDTSVTTAAITPATTAEAPDATVTIPDKLSTEKKSYNQATTIKNDIAANGNTVADSNFIYKPGKQPTATPVQKYAEAAADDFAKSNTAPVTANEAPASVANNTVNGVTVLNKAANNQAEYDKVLREKKEEKIQYQRDQQLNRIFAAQVVGADNNPLPFANISIKSENFGTYADVKGNFRLVSADSLITVEIKSAGYQPQLFTLHSNVQQNKIVLAEDDLALRQKTVVGYGTYAKSKVSRRATLLKDSVVNVEPADGWDNYNTYVDNNIEIPEDILKKNIHGQVELSFDVKSNGTITNIKVDKSLCDNCDEAAKRLIEQGPQWKTKNGKKGKGKVTVQF